MMRLLALVLLVQTFLVPIVPWTMMPCMDTADVCVDESTCCMSSCPGAACTPEAEVPEERTDQPPCGDCAFIACICCVIPLTPEPLMLSFVATGMERHHAPRTDGLLFPLLDGPWQPPELRLSMA